MTKLEIEMYKSIGSDVYESDSHRLIAKKIFYNFEVGQSCKIDGYIEEELEVVDSLGNKIYKGWAVMQEIRNLDIIHNYTILNKDSTTMVRKREMKTYYIGDRICHKTFTWVNDEDKWLIWRIQ